MSTKCLTLSRGLQMLIISSSVRVCLTRFPCVSVECMRVSEVRPEDEESFNSSEAASVALASCRCSPCVSLTFSFCC